jgi:hypothetical protein
MASYISLQLFKSSELTMEEYEKEMRRLQSLWDAVQTDDEEIIESNADGGSEVDNENINSNYPDVDK